MKKRAVIGISTGLLVDSGGIFPGYHRIYVNRDYVDSVLASGGVPLMLPMSDDQEALEKALSLIDGLILSGGHDVSPINYGEEPHQKLGEICPERRGTAMTISSIERQRKGESPSSASAAASR